jgi:3-(3-hydroxy-phenyl)propionate hydroxylase
MQLKSFPTPYAPSSISNGYQFSQGTGYVLPEYAAVVPQAVHSGAVEHHRILIVGGGLAGLTLACSLAQLGVECVLLDEDNTVGVKGASSRGICYTQKSLEIFDKLGIYRRIAAKGVQWSVGRTFAGDDEIYSFDLKQQNHFSLSQQPAFINIQQFYNEGFLVERIGELGHAQIRWNNRVTHFSNAQGVATFTIATPAGEYVATADYVVDATGSKSPFRQWLGVGVTAKQGDDRWCIADVRFNTRPPAERYTWIEAPFNDHRAVWQHLMADDVWRIDYQMAPDADPAYVSREDVVRERLAKQFGADTQVDIVWVGPYAYRSECVDTMCVDLATQNSANEAAKKPPKNKSTQSAHAARSSQVFFMGDSAKVVSPFGARGGNTGIADADNLAWKLAAVVHGRAHPSLLQSYHAERHEAAKTNVQVTNRTARFLRPADGVEKLFRTATIALAKKYPFARALVNTGRMAVANPYSASPLMHPSNSHAAGHTALPSHSVQNIALQWACSDSNAPPGSLNDLLRWAGSYPLLLVWGDSSYHISASVMAQLRELTNTAGARAVQIAATQGQVRAREAALDPTGQLLRACGLSQHTGPYAVGQPPPSCRWALLRPDSYLAAQGNAIDDSLVHAIARCAGMFTL